MSARVSPVLEIQERGLEDASSTCLRLYGKSSFVNTTKAIFNSTIGSLTCPAYFDNIVCWPPTPSNVTATATCPGYFAGFDPNENATRKCLSNGTWYKNEDSIYWTNYTSCIMGDQTTIVVPFNIYNNGLHYLKYFLPTIKTISRTGYSVSLITLLIAFIIMFSIKKLHCPRNMLHMHLFASFILRAFISLLKDALFFEGVGFNSDIRVQNGSSYFFEDKDSRNWHCKLLTSLFQFCITANYSWILMEGLYLHNLIFRAMFADSSRNITHYIFLGWGFPLLVTHVWVVVRIMFENTYCWTTHDASTMTFLIIRIPTIISILLNLILFIRIAAVIYSKLQAPVYEEARRYQKWARSTLVLAPLFGIHYALLIGMSFNKNDTVELIWLIADQLFASFQGFFVAILYCFLNSEVRTELKPHVHAFLTFAATNNCLKHLFPCRHKYLSSARGRASVCTTMSCSSLFNNGVNHHRNSRTRWDFMARNKNSNIQDRNRENCSRSNVVSWHETPSRWNTSRCSSGSCSKGTKKYSFSSNGSIPNEKITCLVHDKSKSESQLNGESICMLQRNAA